MPAVPVLLDRWIPEPARPRVLALAAGILFAFTAHPAHATQPPEPPPAFEAEYSVHYGHMTVGVAHFSLRYPASDRYEYRLALEPRGLVRVIMRGEVEEYSEGRVVDGRLKPEHYRYEQTGSRERLREVSFDYDDMTAVFDGDKRVSLGDEPGEVLDRIVPQVMLMVDLPTLDGREITYRVADDDEISGYTMRLRGEDRVRVEAGRFDVKEVRRVRRDSDRSTRIWVAPELHHLPVKGEHESSGRTFELRLRSVSGAVTD